MNAIICIFYKCALKFELLITILWLTQHFNKCFFFKSQNRQPKIKVPCELGLKILLEINLYHLLEERLLYFHGVFFFCRQFCISFTLLLVKFWVFCVTTYTSVDMLCIHVYIGAYIQQERGGVFHSVWVCSTHD